jgi:hypothetical protein
MAPELWKLTAIDVFPFWDVKPQTEMAVAKKI